MDPIGTLSETQLVVAAEVASRMSRFSAIPNAEWCTPASYALGRVVPHSAVAVTIADFEHAGIITSNFSTGIYIPGATSDSCESNVSQKRELQSLNWWIKTSSSVVAILGDLAQNQSWAGSRSGKLWNTLGVSDLLVGVGKMPGTIDSRHVVVEIGYTSESRRPFEADASVLRALMPVLVSRAALAFNMPKTSHTMVTTRELEVLEQLTTGKSVKQIAESLDRSEHTIHDHVKSLHRKLGATSRGELIARALGHSLLLDEDGGKLHQTHPSETAVYVRKRLSPIPASLTH